MKKVLKLASLLTSFIMCFSLFGCGSNDNSSFEVIEEKTEEVTNTDPYNIFNSDKIISGNIKYNDISFKLADNYGYNSLYDDIICECDCDQNEKGIIDFTLHPGLNNNDDYAQTKLDEECKSYEDEAESKTTFTVSDVEITKICWQRHNRNGKTFLFIHNHDCYSISFSAETSHCNECSIYSKAETMINSLQFRNKDTIEISTESTTEKEVESSVEEPTETESLTEKEEITLGMRNALSKAKDYLNYTAFSYTGLIKQLEYEGYSNEEATYGADNCGADWNEQAAKKAQSYLDYTSFSRQGLIDQLIYEGFTEKQAEYGVDAVGY